MAAEITLNQIVNTIRGRPAEALDLTRPIDTIASLAEADEASVTWVAGPKWLDAAKASRAAAVIGAPDLVASLPNAITVDDTQSAVADLLDLFARRLITAPPPGIHPTAVVEKGAKIPASAHVAPHAVIRTGASVGERSVIGAGVTIGRDVAIGNDCRLFDRVVIYDRCTLGDRVIIHAGSVIGADGFGYIFRDGAHRKLQHIGTVVIEDDVEIGANAAVDRAKVGTTRVGRGSKIDNLVQVAHNVSIGPNCILVGQVGLSGSVRLGAGCIVGGQVGIADGVQLTDGTRVGARSGVLADVTTPNRTILGEPAEDHTNAKRVMLRMKKLPELFDRVASLEKKVASRDGATDHRETG